MVNVSNSDYDVYIGRGSVWGNPYTHISDRKTLAKYVVPTRAEAIKAYKQYILGNQELLNRIEELRGKRLGCHCVPKRCHGEVLIDILNNNILPKLF